MKEKEIFSPSLILKMNINRNGVEFLFSVYPRDISLPNSFKKNSFYRKQVTCQRDFQRYLTLMSGSSVGVFTSVYDINEEVVIDKIVFDMDSKDLNEVFTEVDILCSRLQDRNMPYGVVFSGKKGAHIYGLLRPVKLQREVASYYLGNLHRSLINNLKTIDTHLIGNVSAMIRIPNTLNGKIYCTPLPFEFRKMSITEILDYSKTQHTLNFFPGELQSIEELSGDFKFQKRENTEEFKDEIKVGSIPSIEILEELIRPCVIKEIQKSNPGTVARVDFVSEMTFLSFSPKQILDVIKQLNWDNFDERQTEYQIRKIFERKLKPYSNSKLKETFGCESNSFYWW